MENLSIFKSLLLECDYCESRDVVGADLLEIKHGFDDAYLMATQPINLNTKVNIPDIMVCIQSDLNDENIFSNLINCVAERLLEYAKQNLTIGYIEAIPGGDRIAFEKLLELIPGIQFFSAAEAMLCGLPIKHSQTWYTTRFHHHLVASYYGCKGVALGIKDGYYDIKHQSIIHNGSGWGYKSVSEDRLPDPSIDAEWSIQLKIANKQKNLLAEYLYSQCTDI